MKSKLRQALATAGLATLALLAVSCRDDDDNVPAGPLTLKQFAVNDIYNRTSETALPIEINDLEIDATNEDPAQYDDLLGSI